MFPSMTRRHFLASGLSLGAAPLTPTVLETLLRQPPELQPQWPGIVLQRDEGELLISGRRRAPVRIKVDSARHKGVAMSMVVSEIAPGAAIPVHRHRNEDELIFLQAGDGMLTLGDRTVAVSAGAMLYGPRGIWHGIQNTGSQTIVWCAIYSPAGFEQYFREVGVPPGEERRLPAPEQVNAIAAKYGMEFRDT